MVQGVAGVNDVFDDQHIAAGDFAAQIFQDADFATGMHGVAVAGRLQKVDLDRQVDLADQIGDEDE